MDPGDGPTRSGGDIEQRLAALDLSSLPTWILDDERGRILWANTATLPLFNAVDRAELLARDFSDLSPASRTRMARFRAELSKGRDVWETWTMYPKGQPHTMRLHASSFALDDGRVVFFVEGHPLERGQDPRQLRGVEALHHTSAMVAMLDRAGAILMQNPAVSRAFGEARVEAWFDDDGAVVAALAGVAGRSAPYQAEVRARTTAGERWHLLEARPTRDPVTGAAAILLEQVDITARREDELTIARQHQEILALSAPLLAVGRDVLALPIIGAFDAERAARITESLLPAITERRIRHVVVDLTGATELDAASAELLLRMTRAIGLLGARAILTGIQAGVAQALVSAGHDLKGALVLRDLHEALAACAGEGR